MIEIINLLFQMISHMIFWLFLQDVNLEDSILISKDFNIDTSVFNEKLLDAKNFSNVKASILINNISKMNMPNSGKTLETQWFLRTKKI